MGLQEKLKKIDTLKTKVDSFGKLSDAIKKKINYKFRLDWNYYSNRMEGGTLTKQETRGVMVGNITVDGKPIKDVMEMNGHDQIVLEVLRLGQGEARISESRIKDIHRAIISVVDNPEAVKLVGNWKETPNEILNYKGEKYGFVAPENVPSAIHDLLNKTNASLDILEANKKEHEHPLIIACDFHLGYVSIHPFFDGNGRTARILFNTILISCGYPPIIINDSEKDRYYQNLGDIQAYGGNPNLFYTQMADLLINSLQLVIDAAEGREIEEKDDLDKRLELLKKMTEQENGLSIQLMREAIDYSKFLDNNVKPLFKTLEKKFSGFGTLFLQNKRAIHLDTNSISSIQEPDLIDFLEQMMKENKSKKFQKIILEIFHKDYKNAGVNAFSASWDLTIVLEDTKYLVYLDRDKNSTIHKLYHQILGEEEIKLIERAYMKHILDHIDQQLEQINKTDG